MLDGFAFAGLALIPMGEGNFILPLKADIRKAIHKNAGVMLHIKLEHDKDFKIDIPDDLQECFDFEPEAADFFHSLPKSHRNYFIKWITDAKTISEHEKQKIKGTKTLVINALQIEKHISHFTFVEAIAFAKEIGAEKTYFTHISHRLGRHADISKDLPLNIELAYDGLRLEI